MTIPVNMHFEDVKETEKEELCSFSHHMFFIWIFTIQEHKLLLYKNQLKFFLGCSLSVIKTEDKAGSIGTPISSKAMSQVRRSEQATSHLRGVWEVMSQTVPHHDTSTGSPLRSRLATFWQDQQ